MGIYCIIEESEWWVMMMDKLDIRKLKMKVIVNDRDIDEYIVFRELVTNKMKRPEWLGDFSRDDLEFMLNHGSVIWVYYGNLEPVCSMMYIPCDKRTIEELGWKMDYLEMVDYGPMFVNPKYVGHGLQKRMLEEMERFAIRKGMRFAIAMVHPDNGYSINNLVGGGFVFKEKREYARGMRNIYMKCLSRESEE